MPTTLVASPTFATSLGVEGLIPEHSVSKAENPNLVYQPPVQPPQDPAPSPLQYDKVNSPYINISTENVTYDTPMECNNAQQGSTDILHSLPTGSTTLSAFDNNLPSTGNNGIPSTGDSDNHNIPSTGTPTPVLVDKLEGQLKDHPDQPFVQKLCTELREGARIGYDGPRISRRAKNLATANINPQIVSENLAKEVSLGRTAGPFDEVPFPNLQVSPIGLVPKKHSNKYRTIFHLCYPKTGNSINSFINKDDFSLSYVTIDDAIKHIQLLVPATVFMAKTDIESAFRLYPVHPKDWELLWMLWQGKYYYDKVLPFGLWSSPFLFNQLSDALEWVLREKCGITYACHFLDDFLIMEPQTPKTTQNSCLTSLNSMLVTFKNFGVPISPGKTAGHPKSATATATQLQSLSF